MGRIIHVPAQKKPAMSEEDKQEEKFDFTGEGEAVGYISLEQARVLAMQTARETPGEYGSEYQTVSMAFEVVQANEGEDYYDVTLAFRPQTALPRQSRPRAVLHRERRNRSPPAGAEPSKGSEEGGGSLSYP